MGERKGQNFYYPPDFDPVKHGNLNRYHGVHALRERAAKIDQGILVIRFEMPFNIWCFGCERHVAMGVRYNAEKQKIGMYYSTPLYEFKMRCHLCENYFIIRTDPKNFDYELVSGLKRQEKRWDPGQNGGVAQTSRIDSQKLATDAMFKLEHGQKDLSKAKDDVPRIERIEEIQVRTKDDFMANQVLRKMFRDKKKEIAVKSASLDALKKRCSLPANLAIVDEHDDDKKLANLLSRYTPHKGMEERRAEKRQKLESQSIFTTNQPSSTKFEDIITKCSNVNKSTFPIKQAINYGKPTIQSSKMSSLVRLKNGKMKQESETITKEENKNDYNIISDSSCILNSNELQMKTNSCSNECKTMETESKIGHVDFSDCNDKRSLSLVCDYSSSSDSDDDIKIE